MFFLVDDALVLSDLLYRHSPKVFGRRISCHVQKPTRPMNVFKYKIDTVIRLDMKNILTQVYMISAFISSKRMKN
jgi:hypothetical protein